MYECSYTGYFEVLNDEKTEQKDEAYYYYIQEQYDSYNQIVISVEKINDVIIASYTVKNKIL